MNAMSSVQSGGKSWEEVKAAYEAAKAKVGYPAADAPLEERQAWDEHFTAAQTALDECVSPDWAAFIYKLDDMLGAGHPSSLGMDQLKRDAETLLAAGPVGEWDFPDGADIAFFKARSRVRGAALIANMADRLAHAIECFGSAHNDTSLSQQDAEEASNRLFTTLFGHAQNQSPTEISDTFLLAAMASVNIDGVSEGVEPGIRDALANAEIVINNMVGFLGAGVCRSEVDHLPRFVRRAVQRDITAFYERDGREVPA